MVSPMELSIALGFTCHAVILCSNILNVPLRYVIFTYEQLSQAINQPQWLPEITSFMKGRGHELKTMWSQLRCKIGCMFTFTLKCLFMLTLQFITVSPCFVDRTLLPRTYFMAFICSIKTSSRLNTCLVWRQPNHELLSQISWTSWMACL